MNKGWKFICPAIFLCVLFHAHNSHAESYTVVTSKGVKAVDTRSRRVVPIQENAGTLAETPIVAAAEEVAEAALPAPLADTFKLHSRPNATKRIYLDFDGHVGAEGDVYAPYTIDPDTTSFSDVERTEIQKIWAAVAEMFAPFDLDITTEEPPIDDLRKSGTGDTRWGLRVVIDSTFDEGWAYIGSFNWSTDQEAEVGCQAGAGWDVPGMWQHIAAAIAHESGHAMNLHHHGDSGATGEVPDDYYWGHWPNKYYYWNAIMGGEYVFPATFLYQWSKGEYAAATTNQDDLAIITGNNGFGYRPDDHSSTTSSATQLIFTNASLAFVTDGVIETRTDVDFFTFNIDAAQNIEFEISPAEYSPCLDILAKIYNSSGSVLYTNNPVSSLGAAFNVSLAPGTYYLSVDGVGYGAPETGYSDYASLGYFSIKGKGTTCAVINPGQQPTLNAVTSSSNSIVCSWSNTGFKLQSRTNLLLGTWLDYPAGTSSPVSVTTSNKTAFLRLIQQ